MEMTTNMTMDDTSIGCVNETSATEQTSAHIVKIVALSLINLAVILGNSLVIASVVTTRKLRTVTNIFIVSLACADLMLGIAVLPFSISLEVVDVWLWGQIWCSMWLAIDVLLCTASILSLCAISLDRYVAVTHPIRYPTIMSGARGRILVASVWILSFVICLPPLLGWNDGSQSILLDTNTNLNNIFSSNSSISISNQTDGSYNVRDQRRKYLNATADNLSDKLLSNISVSISGSENCDPIRHTTCELTTTVGYRIYAAMGSFFIPMFIMAFFYFRIYLTAVKTAASIRRGVLTMRSHDDFPQKSGPGDEEMHLRVHRGGSNSSMRYSSVKSYEWQRGASTRLAHSDGSRSPRLSRESRVSLTAKNGSKTRENTDAEQKSGRVSPKPREMNGRSQNVRDNSGRAHLIVTENTGNGKLETGLSWRSNIFRPVTNHFRRSCRKSFTTADNGTEMQVLKTNGTNGTLVITKESESDKNGNETSSWSPLRALKRSPRRCKLLIREGKGSINVKGHARKFKREAKAAKTLAIIVGAFIICWLPFFTIYLIGAFCQNCVSDIVFAVFFWLGYCNSALNPCIYALFARDFRSAFSRLLRCQRRKRFTQAARADYVTGNRNRLTPPVNENDSTSDY